MKRMENGIRFPVKKQTSRNEKITIIKSFLGTSYIVAGRAKSEIIILLLNYDKILTNNYQNNCKWHINDFEPQVKKWSRTLFIQNSFYQVSNQNKIYGDLNIFFH